MKSTDDRDERRLLNACKKGSIETVRQLLQCGVNPNACESNRISAFMIAAKYNHPEILAVLNEYGANPRHCNDYGHNALHYVTREGDIGIIPDLINVHGIDPNAKTCFGDTAFLIAARYGNCDAMKILVEHGANPYHINRENENAIHLVTSHDLKALVYLLDNFHFDINAVDKKGRSAILIAAAKGDTDIIDLLVRRGADVFCVDHDGRNAVHYAAERDRADMIRHLVIKYGIDCNHEDHDGNTPFLLAAENGQQAALKTLFMLGANPHHRNHYGNSAIHMALSSITLGPHKLGVIRELIHFYGVDPNVQNCKGDTAIHRPRYFGNEAAVETLIRCGAMTTIKNNQGKTFFDYNARLMRRLKKEKSEVAITL